jgi:YegS/Rv2252/BmrU family lipid kinase
MLNRQSRRIANDFMSQSGKLIIVLNGVSRKKKKFYQLLPGLKAKYDVTVWETQHHKHAIKLCAEAVKLKPFGILAAGGDGTLNQVLNGLLKSEFEGEKPPIGIIPLGTGNDFSKLNNIFPTAECILNKVENGGMPTDVGFVMCCDERGEKKTHYFINVASLGMGPEVVRRLFKSNRLLGSTLTYAKASIETFLTHKPEPIEIKTDNWSWSGNLRVLAIANGQSFGGGLYVAPGAKPDDGLFSTFIVGEIPLFKFLLFLQQIKSMKKIQDARIQYDNCQSLSLRSSKKSWIETEGELAGKLPAEIKIIPGGVKFFR